MRRYRIISGDGHVETTTIDYAKHAPAKYADQVPKLVRKPDGEEVWRMGEWEARNEGTLYAGARYDDFVKPTALSYHFPDGSNRPGTGDAVQRLREQDQDGIDAEVLFPGSGVSMARNHLDAKDKEAYLAVVQAYNNFLASEYCAVAPDRLIGNMVLPESGIGDAIAEMERCSKLGLTTVTFRNWPNGGSTPSPEDDRFWAAAIDLDMKLSPHSSFGGGSRAAEPVRMGMSPVFSATTGALDIGCAYSIGQLIHGGVFDRFPKLKIYVAESHAGWIPYWLNKLDDSFMHWYKFHDVRLRSMPSQYVRDHCMFSFITDRLAMKYRYDIGLDNLMWGSDFPHAVGSFPHTKEFMSEIFLGVPEEEKRKVLLDNPCKFYGLDPEKELTPTP